MDNKTLQDFLFVGLYPVWVLITLIMAIFMAAFFLPGRKTSSKRVEHRIRK